MGTVIGIGVSSSMMSGSRAVEVDVVAVDVKIPSDRENFSYRRREISRDDTFPLHHVP
jgi:hypothetical protein